jgi:aldehyde oxidoreductase
MGQGVNTVALQVVCNETGIDPALVKVRIDTEAEQTSGMTTASRATSLVGNALLDAAAQLKKDLETATLADLTGKSYTTASGSSPGRPSRAPWSRRSTPTTPTATLPS